MRLVLLLGLACGWTSLLAAELKVAVLHPLLGDLARNVGGERVVVVDLTGPHGDPHHFEPKPEDLKLADGAAIYLVAGMGLEGYLPKLKGILGERASVLEVGASLPALHGQCDHDGHEHEGHAHAAEGDAHELDPHWWHSIELFRRAARVVADAFAKADPANAATYQANATAYRAQLDELERWTRREIAKIPRPKRQLATAHAAFQYFCKDYGFTAHPLQGINREQMPDPAQLAALVTELKAEQVAAIFPEKESNPKILATLTRDTGIRLAQPLIADGTGGTSYEAVVRHNVTAIVTALAE
jgi:zinc/manganese transport system substrate-binding protein